MITPGYVRTMAAYNAEMNRRVYAAAERAGETGRRENAGAFWTSAHGTLSHLLWADRLWMSRFDGGPAPHVDMPSSDRMYEAFEELRAQRALTDRFICDWADRVTQAWLDSDVVWFSAVLQKEVRALAGFLVMHLFNHQTHHRGQAHALLTRQGQQVGDTDLFLVVPIVTAADARSTAS